MAALQENITRSRGWALPLWLWRGYFRKYLGWILIAVLLMSVEGAALGGISFMVGPMFDEVFVGGNKDAVYWVGGIMFVVFIARAAAGFGQSLIMSIIGLWSVATMRSELVRHVMRLDSLFFQDNSPGALIERVNGDTAAIEVAWNSVFSALGRDVISLVALLGVAISIDWVWTLVAVAGVPLLVVPVALLHRLIHTATRKARQWAAVVTTRLDEVFHGINPIKLNTLEDDQGKRFEAAQNAFVATQIKSNAGQAGVVAAIDLVAGIGFLAVMIYGGFQIIEGQKTVGEFMSFFTAMALIFEPLRRLGDVSGLWQAAVASLERIHMVFELKPTILSPTDPVPFSGDPAQSDVVLRDVSFSYGEAQVLDRLSLVAEAGKTTALVGASGAGKSTVFNILTRLIEPQSGTVQIGGNPVASLELEKLRAMFSVVTQDAALFDESLRENILVGRPDASEDALREAVDAALVANFTSALEKGLSSEAGPRGSNLSGGQRQRIAIARAVLRDAPILLLDEPTSALDTQSEAAVQQALDRLRSGRTTLVIAHRLSTIQHADKIVVMDKGKVVDSGTHDQLMERGGIYAGLYKLQFAE